VGATVETGGNVGIAVGSGSGVGGSVGTGVGAVVGDGTSVGVGAAGTGVGSPLPPQAANREIPRVKQHRTTNSFLRIIIYNSLK
jgi:hypothetical protein